MMYIRFTLFPLTLALFFCCQLAWGEWQQEKIQVTPWEDHEVLWQVWPASDESAPAPLLIFASETTTGTASFEERFSPLVQAAKAEGWAMAVYAGIRATQERDPHPPPPFFAVLSQASAQFLAGENVDPSRSLLVTEGADARNALDLLWRGKIAPAGAVLFQPDFFAPEGWRKLLEKVHPAPKIYVVSQEPLPDFLPGAGLLEPTRWDSAEKARTVLREIVSALPVSPTSQASVYAVRPDEARRGWLTIRDVADWNKPAEAHVWARTESINVRTENVLFLELQLEEVPRIKREQPMEIRIDGDVRTVLLTTETQALTLRLHRAGKSVFWAVEAALFPDPTPWENLILARTGLPVPASEGPRKTGWGDIVAQSVRLAHEADVAVLPAWLADWSLAPGALQPNAMPRWLTDAEISTLTLSPAEAHAFFRQETQNEKSRILQSGFTAFFDNGVVGWDQPDAPPQKTDEAAFFASTSLDGRDEPVLLVAPANLLLRDEEGTMRPLLQTLGLSKLHRAFPLGKTVWEDLLVLLQEERFIRLPEPAFAVLPHKQALEMKRKPG